MDEDKKEYPPSVPFYKKYTGNFVSFAVDEEMLAMLKEVRPGARLILKVMDPNLKASEKSPDGYLEVMPNRG